MYLLLRVACCSSTKTHRQQRCCCRTFSQIRYTVHAGGRSSDLKEPGIILWKHRNQPVLLKTAWAKLSLVSNISGWKTDLAPLRITACFLQRNGLHRTLKSCFCLTLQGQLGTLRQHLQGHVLMAIAEKKLENTQNLPLSHYALQYIIKHTKLHSIPVKHPRNSTDRSMVRRRY